MFNGAETLGNNWPLLPRLYHIHTWLANLWYDPVILLVGMYPDVVQTYGHLCVGFSTNRTGYFVLGWGMGRNTEKLRNKLCSTTPGKSRHDFCLGSNENPESIHTSSGSSLLWPHNIVLKMHKVSSQEVCVLFPATESSSLHLLSLLIEYRHPVQMSSQARHSSFRIPHSTHHDFFSGFWINFFIHPEVTLWRKRLF